MEQRFEAAHPEVDVRWLDMGSQEVLDRVRSEKASPQADVWFGGSAELFARAAAESLLAPFRPTWAEAIPPQGRGPGDLYFAAYRTPAVLVFNSQRVPRAEAPQDWDDLLDPRWRGQILIRDPLPSSTMRAIFGMLIDRSIKQTGDTGRAIRWLRRLDGQTKEYVFNPTVLSQKISRQEGLVTVWDLPDILISRAKGQFVDYTFPTSGTPVIWDPIAVVRGAKHADVARAFVEWIGSAEAQLLAAREVFRLPARVDLPRDSLPDWARDVERAMRMADVDWDRLTRQGAEWMRYWDEHVRGSGEQEPALRREAPKGAGSGRAR